MKIFDQTHSLYQKLYIVNPHLFGSREVINQQFHKGLLGKECPEYESIITLDLNNVFHQRIFYDTQTRFSDTLSFMLQNGIIYTYLTFQKMFSNGELQKITGEATSVELGHIFHKMSIVP
jgi:hypothetical protein